MAEAAGLVLGAVSLLASFKGAIDGYTLIADITTAFEGASFLIVKLKIEQERLQIWGDYYGFNDVEKCARLKDSSENTQTLMLYVLMEMKLVTTNVDKLVTKYGLKMVDVEGDIKKTPNLYQQAWAGSTYVVDAAKKQEVLGKEGLSLRKAFRWTITDGTKFEKLVDNLEYLKDSLERIVPRSDISMLLLGLSSYILPTQNNSSSLNTIQNSNQKLLASCATMKQIKILRGSLTTAVGAVDESDLDQEPPLKNPMAIRAAATWTRPSDSNLIKVLVEWQEINRSLQQTDRDLVFSRIRNLASILSAPKPSLFCLLPCLGLVEDTSYASTYIGHKRVGYVFQYPDDASLDAPPETLHDIILAASTTKDKEKKYAPLGDRFRLAQSLASALLLLHSSKWLHKNLRSSNILFFTPKPTSTQQVPPASPLITSPYLAGFEFSRPDNTNEPSITRPSPSSTPNTAPDPYLHPSIISGSKSTRVTDIYALGILLFEIGIWRPVEKYAQATAEETRNLLLHYVPLLLTGAMGQTYAAVVGRCLSGDFGTGGGDELDKVFWMKVVRELDGCRA